MGSRRDNDGRLNIDAVRDEREGVSTQYTAEWLSNVQMPPKSHSVVQDINEPHSPRVSRSAPALSVKSRQSNAGISRSKLELAHAELLEQFEVDSDDQISDDGNRELNMTSHDHEGNGPYDDAEQRGRRRKRSQR